MWELVKLGCYEWKKFPKREAITRVGQYLRYRWRWAHDRKRGKAPINYWEMRGYSQNGEDGIIQYIFDQIGTTNKYFVEFGVENGQECNTRYLREQGWKGLWMDGQHKNDLVNKEWITPGNIERVFKKYKVPKKFDLLSIDIDFNDYWVWKAIKNYQPRVVVIEYNSCWGSEANQVVKYDPKFTKHDGSDYFGASITALEKLGKKKGYRLVGCDDKGINAFFVIRNLASKLPKTTKINAFRAPKFGERTEGQWKGYLHRTGPFRNG